MSPKFAAIGYVLVLLWLFSLGSVFSETPAPTASPNPSSLSPDKKWEYVAGDHPKIVKAGTNKVALDVGSGEVLWAPDSKRVAFNCGSGRSHTTALYQLRGDGWKALASPDDEILAVADKAIAVQVKEAGYRRIQTCG